MSTLPDILAAAVAAGSLLESARTNILALLGGMTSAIAPHALRELVDAGEWFAPQWVTIREAPM